VSRDDQAGPVRSVHAERHELKTGIRSQCTGVKASWARRALGRGLLGALCFTLLAGCQRPAPPLAPADDSELPAQALSSPSDVARALLSSLRDEARDIASGDRAAARRERQVQMALAAGDEIMQRVMQWYRVQRVRDERKLLEEYTANWGAVLAYYLEGLALDGLSVAKATDDSATVLVPARGAGRTATIRVDCTRGRDGLWRVADLSFVPAHATTQSS